MLLSTARGFQSELNSQSDKYLNLNQEDPSEWHSLQSSVLKLGNRTASPRGRLKLCDFGVEDEQMLVVYSARLKLN